MPNSPVLSVGCSSMIVSILKSMFRWSPVIGFFQWGKQVGWPNGAVFKWYPKILENRSGVISKHKNRTSKNPVFGCLLFGVRNLNHYCIFNIFQQQQLIELIREGRVEDALKFASEQLAERGEEEPLVLEELERTLALLAFEDPSQSPFSDLLSHSHRQKVRFVLLSLNNSSLQHSIP